MALILRVFDATGNIPVTEMYVESATVKKGLDSSMDMSMSVPVNTAAAAGLAQGAYIELYLDGNLLASGELQVNDRGVMEVNKSVKLKGRDILDTLYDASPDPTRVIDDKPLLLVIYEILREHGWRLNDISTIPDKDFVISSLDLRSAESVLDQVRKVLGLQEGVSYLYGGEVLGNRTLNVGTFESDSGVMFRSPAARNYSKLPEHFNIITKLTEKSNSEDIVYYLEAVGGEVKDSFGVHRSILLYDAWDNDNTLAVDPEFPIIEIVPEQRYAVINLEKMPHPGGVSKTVHSASTAAFDFIGSWPTPINVWSGHTFRGVPGVLDSFSLPIVNLAAGFVTAYSSIPLLVWISDMGTPASYGYDHNVATRLYEGTIPVIPKEPGSEYRIDLSGSGVTLDYDRVYGIAFGFDGVPASDYIGQTYNFHPVTGTAVGMGAIRTDLSYSTAPTTWHSGDSFLPLRIITTPSEGDARKYQEFKRFTEFAPQKDGETSSTLAETRAAGQALYDRSIAYLKQRSGAKKFYSMSAIGNDLIVPLGSRASVLGKAQTAVENPVTGAITADNYEVDGDFRVVSFSLDVKGNKVVASYELSDSLTVSEEDVTDLYDKTKSEPQVEGIIYESPIDSELDQEVVSISSGTPPDTELSDGTPALLVEFPYSPPTGRAWADNVGVPYSDNAPAPLTVEMVSRPNNVTLTGVICKIAVGEGWTIDSSLDLECYYIWS